MTRRCGTPEGAKVSELAGLYRRDNQHMNATNTEMGFEVLDRQLSWELETARVPRPAGQAAPDAGAAQR